MPAPVTEAPHKRGAAALTGMQINVFGTWMLSVLAVSMESDRCLHLHQKGSSGRCPRTPHKEFPLIKEYRMASRQIKMPAKDDSQKEVEEVVTQAKRPERSRYLLKVDQQTKNSYPTSEAAQAAALAIKTGFPMVQVSVYDSVENTHTMVDIPAASS